MVVAPASTAVLTTSTRKSGSVRVPSSGDHSTSLVRLAAWETDLWIASSTASGSMRSLYFMCTGEVEMKV